VNLPERPLSRCCRKHHPLYGGSAASAKDGPGPAAGIDGFAGGASLIPRIR
jgi:hypothetical protein